MSTVAVYVGLDYHKQLIQVCVMDRSGTILTNRSCLNHAPDLIACIRRYGQEVHAAIESGSGAANLADELATRHGWIINLAHPGYVARMKQTPDKTDWADARVIADWVRVGYLPKVWLAPRDVRELRTLVRYRQQLVDHRRDVKLRIGALLREARVREPGGRRWGRAWRHGLATLDGLGEPTRWTLDRHLEDLDSTAARMAAAETRLAQVTADDPVIAQLLSLPGIGRVPAWVLRAEIGRFDRFSTGKQLARYCGLTPRNASSGQRQADAGLIKAGNAPLRTALIEAAHRLIRYDPRWIQLAGTLRAAGKPHCVVVAAVANRWVRWLHHQVAGGPFTLTEVA